MALVDCQVHKTASGQAFNYKRQFLCRGEFTFLYRGEFTFLCRGEFTFRVAAVWQSFHSPVGMWKW